MGKKKEKRDKTGSGGGGGREKEEEEEVETKTNVDASDEEEEPKTTTTNPKENDEEEEEEEEGEGEGEEEEDTTTQKKRHHSSKGKDKQKKKKKKKRNLNDGVRRVAIVGGTASSSSSGFTNNRNASDVSAINGTEMEVSESYGRNNYYEETSLLTGGGPSHIQQQRRRIRNIIIGAVLLLAVVAITITGVLLSLPATYSCGVRKSSYYVVHVDAPDVVQADPPLVCAATETLIALNGSHFIVSDGVAPRVTLIYDPFHNATTTTTGNGNANIEETVENVALEQCDNVGVRRRHVEECNAVVFRHTFPSDVSGVEDATYDVYARVAHPQPPRPKVGGAKGTNTECASKADARVLTVIPAPSETEVYPPFACVGEKTEFRIIGHYFLNATPATPSVALCGEHIFTDIGLSSCRPISSSSSSSTSGVAACTEMSFASRAMTCKDDVRESAVPVTNPRPAQCSTPPTATINIAVARRPRIDTVGPAVVCAAQGGARITLAGADFVTFDGAQPIVSVDGEAAAAKSTSSDKCDTVVQSGAAHTVELCRSVSADVPSTVRAGATDAVSAVVTVASPLGTCASSGRSSGGGGTYNITVVPVPLFTRMENTTVCKPRGGSAAGLRVRAAGSFVAEHGSNAFAVAVGKNAQFSSEGTALYSCTHSVVNGRVFDKCSELEFPVPDGVAYDELPVAIRGLCLVEMKAAFAMVPTPVVTSLDIAEVCTVEDTPLVITGSDFLIFHGRAPDVTITTTTTTTTTYTIAGEDVQAQKCTKVSANYRLCTELALTVPAGVLPTGPAQLVVHNGPAEASCAGAGYALTVVPKPVVTAVTDDICEDQNAQVLIEGKDFVPGTTAAFFINTESSIEYPAADLPQTVKDAAVTVNVSAKHLPAGVYVIRLENSPVQGCKTTTAGAGDTLTVHANTLEVLAAEPPTLVAGTPATTRVTIYTRNFADVPARIMFRRSDGRVSLSYGPADIEHDPADYTRLTVVLPVNATADIAAGTLVSYTVIAIGANTCPSTAEAILSVVPNNSFDIASVLPRTLSNTNTNTNINGNDVTTTTTSVVVNAPKGAFSPDLQPNVFLVGPYQTANSDDNTRKMKSVSNADAVKPVAEVVYVSDEQLQLGIAAGELAEGAYDLYIALGEGKGSVKQQALTVSATEQAFTITSATRTVYHGDTAAKVVVEGTHFGASEKYEASLSCRGRAASSPIVAKDITVQSSTQMTITFAIPTDIQPSACALELADTSNGFAATYPGVSVVLESRKLALWDTADLPTAVCAPAAVAYDFGMGDIGGYCRSGETCPERAFVYLIGGDEDKACKGIAPSTNVYRAGTDKHGTIQKDASTWSAAHRLPAGLMHAAAEVVGPYIYLTGGLAAESSAQKAVLRAHVLQPAEAPALTGALRVQQAQNPGLKLGVYYYAVSAVYGAYDACNPGGESLPSNTFVVRVGSVYSRVELAWDDVEDAVAYYVYRTPTPGLAPSRMALLATVQGKTSYADTGADSPDEKHSPETLGAIGNWATLPGTMTEARYGHASAVTRSSVANYLFALGGLNAVEGTITAARATHYETVKIMTTPPASTHGRTKHTLEDWILDTRQGFPTRAFWRASVLDKSNIGFNDYISAVVLGGSDVELASYGSNYVDNNPSFISETLSETPTPDVSAFGYCQVVSDNVLYNIGGSKDLETFTPVQNKESSHVMILK